MSRNVQSHNAEEMNPVKERSHQEKKISGIFQAHGNVHTESLREQVIRSHAFIQIIQYQRGL